ncbi:DUF47 domain-containing protein [Methylococcus capsulatus]|jgi:hypothetical protein|uniref:DUF47 domain-containing protein n=1 Tax=Methylococcus capsulatus TaxID=414 RepID=UPI002FD938A9
MNFDHADLSLKEIFQDHLSCCVECGQALERLFAELDTAETHIGLIRQLEEKGDALMRKAYDALETAPYSELVLLIQQFAGHLDDILDGLNDTARVIDIFTPRRAETAALDLLAISQGMVRRLSAEMDHYPENPPAGIKRCREELKVSETDADLVYHEWRKSQRRYSTLSLLSESDWTEILGILEKTTDSCYHAALVLERITKYRLRQAS